MKRKFFGMLLMGAMTIASVSMFTSCKDYDDDINNLQAQIDAITKQDLQNQLNTLKTALESEKGALAAAQAAQKAASDAAKAASDAAKAAEAAQGTANQGVSDAEKAAKAAEAAQKAAEAAQATADLCAKQATVDQLQTAVDNLKPLIDGKVAQKDFDDAIAKIQQDIVAINQNLLTIGDVEDLLKNADFAENAVIQDLVSQIGALNKFKESMTAIDPIGNAEWKTQVDAAIASLEGIKSDIAGKAAAADVEDLKTRMKTAEDAILDIADGIGAAIEILNIYVARDLKSIVLRPSTYYGGIEGVSVYTYEFPKELPNKDINKKELACNNVEEAYRYFERQAASINISNYGFAEYHINPSNVDLTNFSIDFYSHVADLYQPAADEMALPADATRSGANLIEPVYKNTDALIASYDNTENSDQKKLWLDESILTVPFTAKAATIDGYLKNHKATIASLSLTKVKQGENPADTTVNSDYAIVVPRYGYGLLIGDNLFEPTTPNVYEDIIGLDGGDVNSANLHRNFSFLALSTTSATHEIKYDSKFNISEVLESRVVKSKADWKAIKDTASLCDAHKATAEWFGTTVNPTDDSNATIEASKVETLTDALMKRLGLHYEIQPVHYTLGSNKTGETVHLTLETDNNGDVWARPCNVTSDGETIVATDEKPANPACVGRQPIVCIMVKDNDGNIVSFAYMKFLITPDEPVDPVDKAIEFEIGNIWVNCDEAAGRVTWSQIEYHLLDQALEGMSKADFDKNYIFDYYKQEIFNVDDEGATFEIVTRHGVQYDENGKRINVADEFGDVSEQWNLSAQGVEDATTHIIKWSFTADELAKRAQTLKDKSGLEDKGDYYVNKDPIVTYVRYAHVNYTPEGMNPNENDAPAVGEAPKNGLPSIWIKLILKAGELHVAKGDMGANKILTFWYDLNSKTNATSSKDAYEVRVNVPVPVPEASATEKTIGYDYLGYDAENKKPILGGALNIRYDNLLEKANDPLTKRTASAFTEFTKDLKDFFIDGKLTATVKEAGHFANIKGMKLGCEFIYPSKAIGNVFQQGDAITADGAKFGETGTPWTVKGYTKSIYTLEIDDTRTNILIVKKDGKAIVPADTLITLNYDANEKVADRQVTVLNYVNGENQDDILNFMTHNELGQRETFTAYINIKAIDACAPVYWDNMWFNVRFLRPLDLENPKQAVVPDAPNDWHTIDLTDALIVKDWREYYGDRQNRTGGKDVSLVLPSVGNQKAFDYAYYQVELDITDNVYYTDANLGTSERSDVFTLGHMPVIVDVDDAKAKGFILTSQVPNLKLEKTGKTTLRYLNNSGVTGGFHVFVPITMTYVYGFQTVRQTKWVTVGVTPSVEQAMIEDL